MLQYPSIEGYSTSKQHLGKQCIAFNKYDGSNLRWEWNPKQGWHKFGTRRTMFDATTEPWSKAIPLFMEIAPDIEYRVMRLLGKNIERITAFTELYGPSSFAGQHDWSEPKELKLFDVFTYKKGFIQPQQFVDAFGKQPYCAEVVYRGPFTESLKEDVFNGGYEVSEGVIVKGLREPFSCKLKTRFWYQKLKARYGDQWEQYA